LSFRTGILALCRRFGYEVRGPLSAYAAERSLKYLIGHERINSVLDVGANVGQFAMEMREMGYTGKIISFEALQAAHYALVQQAAKDSMWTVAPRSAIGAVDGSIEMQIANNSVSSSVLPMLDSHREADPQSYVTGTESVPMVRLDSYITAGQEDRFLLKIDVQGYEQHVLEGARGLLPQCRAVKLEMSLLALYEGAASPRRLWDWLQAEGFEPWAFEPGFRHPVSQRMLQMDGIFVRAEKPGTSK
jgi:FkbM family methyltransferase